MNASTKNDQNLAQTLLDLNLKNVNYKYRLGTLKIYLRAM